MSCCVMSVSWRVVASRMCFGQLLSHDCLGELCHDCALESCRVTTVPWRIAKSRMCFGEKLGDALENGNIIFGTIRCLDHQNI